MLEELVGDVGVDGVGVASCVDTELLGSGLAGDNGGVGGALATFGGGIGESSVSSSKMT